MCVCGWVGGLLLLLLLLESRVCVLLLLLESRVCVLLLLLLLVVTVVGSSANLRLQLQPLEELSACCSPVPAPASRAVPAQPGPARRDLARPLRSSSIAVSIIVSHTLPHRRSIGGAAAHCRQPG